MGGSVSLIDGHIDESSEKSRTTKFEYYVWRHSFNRKIIEKFNVFDHGRFLEDVKKDLKKCETKEEFAERLKGNLFYYYRSKCEHEVVITSWVPHIAMSELERLNKEREESIKKYNREPYCLHVNPDVAEKIDIYDQIMLNWNLFVDYVWSHKRSKK